MRNTAHPVMLLTFLKFISGLILKESKNRVSGVDFVSVQQKVGKKSESRKDRKSGRCWKSDVGRRKSDVGRTNYPLPGFVCHEHALNIHRVTAKNYPLLGLVPRTHIEHSPGWLQETIPLPWFVSHEPTLNITAFPRETIRSRFHCLGSCPTNPH